MERFTSTLRQHLAAKKVQEESCAAAEQKAADPPRNRPSPTEQKLREKKAVREKRKQPIEDSSGSESEGPPRLLSDSDSDAKEDSDRAARRKGRPSDESSSDDSSDDEDDFVQARQGAGGVLSAIRYVGLRRQKGVSGNASKPAPNKKEKVIASWKAAAEREIAQLSSAAVFKTDRGAPKEPTCYICTSRHHVDPHPSMVGAGSSNDHQQKIPEAQPPPPPPAVYPIPDPPVPQQQPQAKEEEEPPTRASKKQYERGQVRELREQLKKERQARIKAERRQGRKPKAKRGAVPGLDHCITHLPADPNCEACIKCKMQAAPKTAPGQGVTPKATAPLDKVHVDLLGPTTVAIPKETHAMLMRDEKSNCLKGAGMKGTTSAEARAVYSSLLYNERKKPDVTRTDGGPEFRDEFHRGLLKDGTVHDLSHAHKPSTNAGIERYIRLSVEGTRTVLYVSGLPLEFWVYAFVMWCRNFNIGTLNPSLEGEELAPWQEFRQTADPPPAAIPFGCKITYLEPLLGSEKFAPKGKDEVTLGYARNGAMAILDLDTYLKMNRVRILHTRDVKVHPDAFPLAGLKAFGLERTFRNLLFARGAEMANEILDDGSGNCKICERSLSQEPLRCPACRPNPAHRRHKRDEWCKLGRCPEHKKEELVDFFVDRRVAGHDAKELQQLEEVEPGEAVSVHIADDAGIPLVDQPDAKEPSEPASPIRRIRLFPKQPKEFANQALQQPKRDGGRPLAKVPAAPSIPSAPPLSPDQQQQVQVSSDSGSDAEMSDVAPMQLDMEEPIDMPMPMSPEGPAAAALPTGPRRFKTGPSLLFDTRRVRRGYDGKVNIIDTPFGSCVAVQPEFDYSQLQDEGLPPIHADRDLFSQFHPPYAAVTKVVSLTSPEAQTGAAKLALEAEYKNVVDNGVWDPSDAVPWAQIEDQTASILRVHAILGIKHWEERSEHRFKARIVAGGHDIRDWWGGRAESDALYTLPIGLGALRQLLVRTVVTDEEALQWDVTGAYLQTPRSGPPTYAGIPTIYMNDAMLEMHRAGLDPVVPLKTFLYGEPNSGDKWAEHFKEKMLSMGWTLVETVSGGMIFRKGGVSVECMWTMGRWLESARRCCGTSGT